MILRHYVIMGVSGCGKTSVGNSFADAIGAPFIDADDLHPAKNIAKMAEGKPLNDDDRWPWLRGAGEILARAEQPTVLGCSALKRSYRDCIRTAADEHRVTFVYLSGSRDRILSRMSQREGHFMPVALLDSQFETLEPPKFGEDAVVVDIDTSLDEVVQMIVARTQAPDRR